MKFYGDLGCGPETKRLHFADDPHHYRIRESVPDHSPDPVIRIREELPHCQHTQNRRPLGFWPRDQVITFCWQSGSLSGSRSPKSEIRIHRILAFGGGLHSLSTCSSECTARMCTCIMKECCIKCWAVQLIKLGWIDDKAVCLLFTNDSMMLLCFICNQHGACVNAMDLWQFTPLHEATSKNRTEVCSLLLSHGADPTLVNCHSKSALDVAPTRELADRIQCTLSLFNVFIWTDAEYMCCLF